MDAEKRINEIVEEISAREREILNDFTRAYLSSLSLGGRDVKDLLLNGKLRLCRKDPSMWDHDKFIYQYWYELNE